MSARDEMNTQRESARKLVRDIVVAPKTFSNADTTLRVLCSQLLDEQDCVSTIKEEFSQNEALRVKFCDEIVKDRDWASTNVLIQSCDMSPEEEFSERMLQHKRPTLENMPVSIAPVMQREEDQVQQIPNMYSVAILICILCLVVACTSFYIGKAYSNSRENRTKLKSVTSS